eukprot:Gb_21684 [translate_table: standard]
MKVRGRLDVWNMGLVQYSKALILQEQLVNKRRMGIIPDTLLSLQHPPTYTLGKRRTTHNLLVPPLALQNMGAELHYTERGGDVTFHGPHQSILYPILSLRELGLGVRKYVEHLEDTMIKLASLYGLQAQGRMKGQTGVWVSDRKIGAIGVKISSGITSHGLAFNIDPDLNFYSHIVPCGISDKEVTSLRREALITLPEETVVTRHLIDCFIDIFDFKNVTWNENNYIMHDIEDVK